MILKHTTKMHKYSKHGFRDVGHQIFTGIFHYLIIHDGTQTHNTDMDVILSFTHVKLGDMP